MNITDVAVHIVALPTRREHNWASKMTAPIGRHAIIEIRTDDGLTGWGEAPAGATWGGAHMRYYGESVETVRHVVVDYLTPAIMGIDPTALGPLHDSMDRVIKGHPYAKAAVDVACYDLAGQALGVPVYTLLGGRRRPGVALTHSLGIMEVERCLEEAEQAVAEGARTIKAKTGLDSERDVTLVRELRRVVGPGIKIRVDANEGYGSVHEAIEITRRQEEFGLMLCEQPVAGIRQLAQIAARIDTPVMADESAWTVQDILELAELQAAACFSCYYTKPGGIYRGRQQAEVADALGMTCDIGGSIETGIGNAANLHLGVSLPNAVLPSVCSATKPAGTAGTEIAGRYYLDDLVSEAFRFEDGMVIVPEGPGLGIAVDREKLERYRV